MEISKANEWVDNTFSEWTKEEDRKESIEYLIKRIYDDEKNKKCDNCVYLSTDDRKQCKLPSNQLYGYPILRSNKFYCSEHTKFKE